MMARIDAPAQSAGRGRDHGSAPAQPPHAAGKGGAVPPAGPQPTRLPQRPPLPHRDDGQDPPRWPWGLGRRQRPKPALGSVE